MTTTPIAPAETSDELADFVVPAGFMGQRAVSVDPLGAFVALPAPIPGPLVALIMEVSQGAIPWPGGRASVEASMAAVGSMAAVVFTVVEVPMAGATGRLSVVLIKT